MGIPVGCPGLRVKSVGHFPQAIRQQVPAGCELPPNQPALPLQCTPPPRAFSALLPPACSLAVEPAFSHIVTPLPGCGYLSANLRFHPQGARVPRVSAPLWHPAARACVPHHSHAWGCQKDGKHKHRWISPSPFSWAEQGPASALTGQSGASTMGAKGEHLWVLPTQC